MKLTKSIYTQAITCLKTLWRDKYKNKSQSPTNKTTQTRLETGKQVGALACQLFPNGRKIEYSSQEQMAMIDIFKIMPDGLEIYEVVCCSS